MAMPSTPALLAVVAALAVAATGCGMDDAAPSATERSSSSAATSSPDGRAADGSKLPPELAEIEAQVGELLDGGAEAFEDRLAQLEGHPVVVNKWASWCAPCRAEFPFFQSQAEKHAGEVAFLGVDSSDNDADALSFLEEFPVPYPSYTDPELEVADVFNGVAAFPTTAFYDEKGELVYLKQGGYASEELLAEDIERYAG
jgi:cytochrome c biogenesis protein CcmG, thiol:disulfide interchange protein DsbE